MHVGMSHAQTFAIIRNFHIFEWLESFFQKIVIYIAPNASFFSLKCTKIIGVWGSAPDPAESAYSAPPEPLAVMGWRYEICEFTEFLGLPGCVPNLTIGNNICNFVCIYQKFSIFELSKCLENNDLYGTKCFLFSLKCSRIVGDWGSAPDPAGGAYSAPQTP